MLMKFLTKTKYFFNIVLPFVLLFQWTLPTIEKKRNFQTNFGEFIFVKCNDREHSHPPLSERKTSNDRDKFVNSELNNLSFINKPPKCFNISGENNYNKSAPLPEISLAQFPPARGPPILKFNVFLKIL